MELEKLKTYIKNNLVNDFIKSSKSLIKATILLNNKLDRNQRLCVNY